MIDATGSAPEKWLQTDYPNTEQYCHRKFLPSPMTKKTEESNLWSLVKSNTGKDLSKTTMPIHLNEPISFLQRISEYMEYSNLLFQASLENDPITRLELITAFVISDVSSTYKRSGKPFNPLLGETFELNRKEERGYIFVSEQVSHHPPISAFHVEAEPYFRFWGSLHPKLQFWGKSLEIYPKGNLYIQLLEYNEIYTWENVPSVINNLLIGKVNICHQGENTIRCLTNNFKSVLKWKADGWFKISDDCSSNRIEAHLYNSKSEKVKVIYGRWNEMVFSVSYEDWKQRNDKKLWRTPMTDSTVTGVVSKLGNLRFFPSSSFQITQPSSLEVPDMSPVNHNCSSPIDCKKINPSSSSCASSPTSSDDIDLHLPHQTCLWKVSRRPPHSRLYYDFTYFTLILNEIPRDYNNLLPPTDSRKRPDIRLLEHGNIDEASKEKCRLENKQRQTRKKFKTRKCSQECSQALWFDYKLSEYSNVLEWTFNGKYFQRNWESCPDIF